METPLRRFMGIIQGIYGHIEGCIGCRAELRTFPPKQTGKSNRVPLKITVSSRRVLYGLPGRLGEADNCVQK